MGKTLVSSAMIDRVVNDLGRKLVEVPVGFKWFVDGLFDGNFGFGGEESAGASFLRFDGTPWSTDKDGIIMCLLAAEITAVTGKTRRSITTNWRNASVRRAITVCRLPRPPRRKRRCPSSLRKWSALTPWRGSDHCPSDRGAGQRAAIGGLKVMTDNGWFAARPSGTEDAYKIYCESFLGEEHRKLIEKKR